MLTENDINLEPIPSEVEDLEVDNASYKINTYGADFTLELLSSKLDDNEIIIPDFQRNYVWNAKKASKLVESFLLGLPVPQIFLYRQDDTQDMMVVDGQQRLKSINYFFKEQYEDQTTFRLQGVKPQWEGKTYSQLDEQDKRKFKNSILRATIFEQTDPADHSSVFEIFARLNTGGMTLTAQEIRNCVINGRINTFLTRLNEDKNWRALLGRPNADSRMKDIEMILRFFALNERWETYVKPMKEFISTFMLDEKDITPAKEDELSSLFKSTTKFIVSAFGVNAFRLRSAVNVAVMDSLMVAVAQVGIENIKNPEESYKVLVSDPFYKEATANHTTDLEKVQGRIKVATRELAK